jgi:hypothetical protein
LEAPLSQDTKDVIAQALGQKPWPAPEIAIPEAAQTEIKRMHADLVAKAKAFEAARMAFGEFVRTAKKALNVPANENWDIKPDASAFVKLPDNQAQSIGSNL